MNFRIKKKLIYASILLATAIITIAGEVYSRFILGLGSPPLSIVHPTIEYMFKPNQNVYRFGNHVIINEYGMRSDSFSVSKQKDEIRIMVFGDSVVNGGNLTDQNDLATEIIKRKINQQGKYKKVTVGNISAGSWGPGNWLGYAKEYGFFNADFLVLVTNSDDYIDNPTFAPINKNSHPTSQPISALAEGIERYLPGYLPNFEDKKSLSKNPANNNLQLTSVASREAQAKKGIHDLTNFLELAKKQHKPIIVIQTLKATEVNSNEFEPGYYQIRKTCTNLEIKCISLEPYLIKAIHNHLNPYRDNDEIHINAIGQSMLAEAILANFKQPKIMN